MADPINWGAFDPSQTAAGLTALQPHVVSQYTNQNAFQAAPGSAADLAYQGQMAQTKMMQQAGLIQFLAGQQQRAIDQQNANSTQLTAQANAANLGIVNQRENAVAEATIDKTNADTAGTSLDVAAKAREELKQRILLQASQTGGLGGYMDALQSVDPDKYLDVTKKQQDITTGILGQKKSILDLQGTERDQAVKSFGDMNKILYAVETSPNPQDSYKKLLPTMQEINPNTPPEYDESWVTGHFVAGLNAAGAAGGASGGLPSQVISALPKEVQGATAFASGSVAPIQSQAATKAAQGPTGIGAGQQMLKIINQNGGKVPLIGGLASTEVGQAIPEVILPEKDQQYRKFHNQYSTSIKTALAGRGMTGDALNEAADSYVPEYGEAPEVNNSKGMSGIELLQRQQEELNPKNVGGGVPNINAEQTTKASAYSTNELTAAAALAVQQGHYPNVNIALADLTRRAQQ